MKLMNYTQQTIQFSPVDLDGICRLIGRDFTAQSISDIEVGLPANSVTQTDKKIKFISFEKTIDHI